MTIFLMLHRQTVLNGSFASSEPLAFCPLLRGPAFPTTWESARLDLPYGRGCRVPTRPLLHRSLPYSRMRRSLGKMLQ